MCSEADLARIGSRRGLRAERERAAVCIILGGSRVHGTFISKNGEHCPSAF
jgi:hypothetical protein